MPFRDGKFYKSHFKVKFDEAFDLPKGDPARQRLKRRRFAGMRALSFKWSRHNDWDPYANLSKINELFSYQLLREAGVHAPRMSMGTLQLRIDFIPYDFDISLGTNWHGEMSYEELIDQDILETKSLPASWGDTSPRPLVDKVLAVEEYRQRYPRYLAEYVAPTSGLFLYSRYQAKFDQIDALYRGRIENDTADPDPMGLAGYEKRYFSDKTKSVLGQLGLGSSGYEVEP